MMVTHPSTLSQVDVIKHLLKKGKILRLSDLMTNTLGDMSSTHGKLQVSSDTLKYITLHHDMSLMHLYD